MGLWSVPTWPRCSLSWLFMMLSLAGPAATPEAIARQADDVEAAEQTDAGAARAEVLEPSIELDTVLVTVGRVLQPERHTLTPVSVLDREEIELRQAGDLSDLLFGIPGVTSAQGPRPEAMVPNIRGLGEGRGVRRRSLHDYLPSGQVGSLRLRATIASTGCLHRSRSP